MLCSHVLACAACGGTLSRVSAASLRPYLIPACVRASAAGLRPHLIPASGRPPCGSVSAAGRRLYIAPACGRASVPYPGVRPRKRGRPAHALLACAAGLRRHLIPCERGEPCYMLYCTARTGLF